ncbi:uncharacterized protein LOC114434993 [Parambassis ranga]|uniref:Uncharacterized protein LOC114434993 n=1 Tax=Parambassis ranga TaxID=210632 RepID=A0A6P7I6K6_9TELE|nr:uncharacterized protein LOC114434993 [Parambassis ranga]
MPTTIVSVSLYHSDLSTSHPLPPLLPSLSLFCHSNRGKQRNQINRTKAEKMDLTCFTSSDPAAANATKLYDDSTDSGHIWYRDTLSVPLPSFPPPSEPQCSPCYVQEKFFIVCRNLTEKMDLVLEGEGGQVDIERSDCPPPSEDSLSPAAIFFIVIGIIIIIIIISVLYYCKHKLPKCGSTRQSNTSTPSDSSTFLPATTKSPETEMEAVQNGLLV